ncbi:hypothetical protein Tco_0496454 [Tanacetum coccineum]
MNNSVTIAYRFEITLQLCLFDGSKPKNNDELQPRLSNFFKNFDSNGGDDLCYQGGLDQSQRLASTNEEHWKPLLASEGRDNSSHAMNSNQELHTIKKVKDSDSYEFLLANKRCIVDAEVFRKILDICPRVKGKEYTEVQDDDATLTFLIDLGYKGPLHKYTNMYVDHMHQPWRTLAAIVNKCLSRKTESNNKLRKFRIDIP